MFVAVAVLSVWCLILTVMLLALGKNRCDDIIYFDNELLQQWDDTIALAKNADGKTAHERIDEIQHEMQAEESCGAQVRAEKFGELHARIDRIYEERDKAKPEWQGKLNAFSTFIQQQMKQNERLAGRIDLLEEFQDRLANAVDPEIKEGE